MGKDKEESFRRRRILTVKQEQLSKRDKVNEKALFIKLVTTINTVNIFPNLMALMYAFSGLILVLVSHVKKKKS